MKLDYILYLIIFIELLFILILQKEKRKESKENKNEKVKFAAELREMQTKWETVLLEYQKVKTELDTRNADIYKEKEQIRKELDDYKTEEFNRVNNEIKEHENLRNSIVSKEKEIIGSELELFKTQKLNEINQSFYDRQAVLDKALLEYSANIDVAKDRAKAALDVILNELEDYRKKRNVINDALLREKEIREKETFYRLCISEQDIEDIKALEDIKSQIHNKEILQKLVYESYIKKPLTDLTKRLFQGKKVSGIYKITNIQTQEAYVGKSVDVGSRWQEHLKSSLGIGTIAHSNFHKKLAEVGVWNFTWEVLEDVPKENLSEREKYWIDFYETDKYGMNEKAGG